MKRAIVMGGGGPAVGLHLGALKKFAEEGITFDVWALACVGAWAGIVFNQHQGEGTEKARKTYEFFREIFRDDASYSRFPVNTVFGPDLSHNAIALLEYWCDPKSYKDLFLPEQMGQVLREGMALRRNRQRWTREEVSRWVLSAMAVNPFLRLLTGSLWQSNIHGLTKLYYPGAQLLTKINFKNLFQESAPFIYHNAWNLSRSRMELFANKVPEPDNYAYGRITAASLCACSALPFIEDTVNIDGDIYCEGALRSALNFDRLIEDHGDLDEIWVVRIIDVQQVKPPTDLKGGLENLMMLFAGAVGEDGAELFRYKAKEKGWRGKIIEVPVSTKIHFDWTHSNLDLGCEEGYAAATVALSEFGGRSDASR